MSERMSEVEVQRLSAEGAESARLVAEVYGRDAAMRACEVLAAQLEDGKFPDELAFPSDCAEAGMMLLNLFAQARGMSEWEIRETIQLVPGDSDV